MEGNIYVNLDSEEKIENTTYNREERGGRRFRKELHIIIGVLIVGQCLMI